jgi:hypothetical protein
MKADKLLQLLVTWSSEKLINFHNYKSPGHQKLAPVPSECCCERRVECNRSPRCERPSTQASEAKDRDLRDNPADCIKLLFSDFLNNNQ